MTTSEGVQLSQRILKKVDEMSKICEGLDEDTAGRIPDGRWSPKQILSHLCGPEEVSLVMAVKAILDQDVPRMDIEAENPFFTEKRSRMTLAELLAEFKKGYSQIADLVAGLSQEQLNRKAHVPLFKDIPIGEYPTLSELIGAIVEYHMDFHINHMKEIREALGTV